MAAPKKPDIPADKLALYDKLIATHPRSNARARPILTHRSMATCFLFCWDRRASWLSGYRKMNEKSF
jgi:hypothetical protein